MLKKLGTLFNTVGSLGVGYYVGTLGLIYATPERLQTLTDLDYIQLGGSVLLMAIGLFLRFKDIFDHKKVENNLLQAVEIATHSTDEVRHDAEDEITHLKQHIDNLEQKDADQEEAIMNVLDGIVARHVHEALPHIVEKQLAEKE